MKKILIGIFSLFFVGISCGTDIRDKDILGPNHTEEFFERAWLVHLALDCPFENNQFKQGASIVLPPQSPEGASRKVFLTPDHSPVYRRTYHFAFGHAVQSHEDGSWDDCPFALLVPLKELVPYCVGGFLEDIFFIGPFPIPSSSILLSPSTLGEDQYNIIKKNFTGNLKTYTGDLKESIQEQLKLVNAYTIEIQEKHEALVDGRLVSQREFLKPLTEKIPHFQWGFHSQSIFYTLEEVIRFFCKPLWDIHSNLEPIICSSNKISFYSHLLDRLFTYIQKDLKSFGHSTLLGKWYQDLDRWKKLFLFDATLQKEGFQSIFLDTEFIKKCIEKRREEKEFQALVNAYQPHQALLIQEEAYATFIPDALRQDAFQSYPTYQLLCQWSSEIAPELDYESLKLEFLVYQSFLYAFFSEEITVYAQEKAFTLMEEQASKIEPKPFIRGRLIELLRYGFNQNDSLHVQDAYRNYINARPRVLKTLNKYLADPGEGLETPFTLERMQKLGIILAKETQS